MPEYLRLFMGVVLWSRIAIFPIGCVNAVPTVVIEPATSGIWPFCGLNTGGNRAKCVFCGRLRQSRAHCNSVASLPGHPLRALPCSPGWASWVQAPPKLLGGHRVCHVACPVWHVEQTDTCLGTTFPLEQESTPETQYRGRRQGWPKPQPMV